MSSFNFDKFLMILLTLALSGCALQGREPSRSQRPLTLNVKQTSLSVVTAEYRLSTPTSGLHFARDLGGYRKEAWRHEQVPALEIGNGTPIANNWVS